MIERAAGAHDIAENYARLIVIDIDPEDGFRTISNIWEMKMDPEYKSAIHLARMIHDINDGTHVYEIVEENVKFDFGKAKNFHSKLAKAIEQKMRATA
jgi:DNA primase